MPPDGLVWVPAHVFSAFYEYKQKATRDPSALLAVITSGMLDSWMSKAEINVHFFAPDGLKRHNVDVTRLITVRPLFRRRMHGIPEADIAAFTAVGADKIGR